MKNIYIIAGGPGDAELITVKAKKIIDKSDYIFSSSKYINKDLYEDVKDSCQIFDSFSKDYDEKIDFVKNVVKEGKIISFVTMGDSFLYGMIGGLTDRLDKNNLDFEIIPGVSSLNASSAILKKGFTGLGTTNTLVCTTLKNDCNERNDIYSIAGLDATVVLFMAVSDIDVIVSIFKEFYGDDYPVSVISKATWDEEKVIVSNLKNIENEVKDANITDGLVILGEFLAKQYDYIMEREFEERMKVRREKEKSLKIMI